MWFEGHRVLCRERHFNIFFSMYCTHILYLELKFSCFHWLGFRLLHNFCLYLLLDQVTIDLVHYHIVHLHVLWSIILCNQSGHHAQEDWVKLKHAFKNACCIKNITHKNLTNNCIFSCLTFFLHWVVFLIFMEVRIKMNAYFKPHLTLHI
jgi:hypothetical protein